ncbi:MAG: phosphoglucosamine mutase [Methanobacterium sp.]|jgi:phosphoglucosamine mutase|uniref:phosphoglucosamine mutase n=1 Tax=Methanobacterium sp. TaxID=2164 RepID=UPI0003C94EC0|nr:phosphoglucosamine mutase [Methanobacterium sp.]MDI3550515.1 phosphoglucosamine mutase [Methanobacterium sp.]CDG64517.1 putative phosphoglucosamine mutase [Methanobacterium sp. MB1]
METEIPRLFGTSGIRGKIEEDITPELALKVGRAISTYLGEDKKIVVGYDTRTSNLMLERALSSGILQGGCHVLSVGMVPTPVVGYTTMKLEADAGVMITASHNPSPYNGIKLWNPDGMAYLQEQERTIERIIHENKFYNAPWENIGKIIDVSPVVNDYIEDLLDLMDIQPGLKVVVDCANGAASYLSPFILKKAGCEVVSLNAQPDGFFPGRKPEPSEPNLKELMKVVKVTGADLGIAHDGDADRMVAVDDKGRMADFDKLLALVSAEMGGCVVTTVDASACIDRAMEEVGGTVERTKVGDVHVAEMIHNIQATFGGEPSGTWLHPEFCMCPDGILSALKVIKLVQTRGPLSSLLDNIPVYPTMRDKIDCREDQKDPIMEKVKTDLPSLYQEVIDVNLKDGVRISFEDGSWVLVRPSGTESFIRITLEGKTEDKARMIHEKAAKFIHELL